MLRRRTFLQALANLALASAGGTATTALFAASQPKAPSLHLSIGDFPGGASQNSGVIQKRLDLYSTLGIGMLRTLIRWADVERLQGQWTEPSNLRYLQQAKNSGMRFRMAISTLGSPPDWLFKANDDALIRNQRGETTKNDISPWYPPLRPLLSNATESIFSRMAQWNLIDSVDYILVDLGPAGEPIYPPAWGLGPGHDMNNATFWFFDIHAKANFIQHMRAKYADISMANRNWNTDYHSWDDVAIPTPPTKPGVMWRDVLLWYRDSKRELLEWQLANYKEALTRHARGPIPALVIMDSGNHLAPSMLDRAVASGDGDYPLKIMPEIEYILDLAQRSGCWVQYPAVEEADELAYITNYITTHNLKVPMWGENAGGLPAHNPRHLADMVMKYNLFGLEYVNAGAIFQADGVTPNDNFAAFAAACRQLTEWFS